MVDDYLACCQDQLFVTADLQSAGFALALFYALMVIPLCYNYLFLSLPPYWAQFWNEKWHISLCVHCFYSV